MARTSAATGPPPKTIDSNTRMIGGSGSPLCSLALRLFPKRIVLGPFHQQLGTRFKQGSQLTMRARGSESCVLNFSSVLPGQNNVQPVLGEDSHGLSWMLRRLYVRC